MSECLFCKIVKGDINLSKVMETENVLAFNDINPQAPVHVLVIPKVHISSITKVQKEHSALISDMMQVINEVAKKTGIVESGFRVVVNHGENAGQAVPHLHFHVLGGRKMTWPPG